MNKLPTLALLLLAGMVVFMSFHQPPKTQAPPAASGSSTNWWVGSTTDQIPDFTIVISNSSSNTINIALTPEGPDLRVGTNAGITISNSWGLSGRYENHLRGEGWDEGFEAGQKSACDAIRETLEPQLAPGKSLDVDGSIKAIRGRIVRDFTNNPYWKTP